MQEPDPFNFADDCISFALIVLVVGALLASAAIYFGWVPITG